jgi:hypothetical protein
VVFGGNGIAYTAAMTGLYQLWYKDHDLTKFHFFNDNKQWNQMDKAGHIYSCYYEGVVGISMMKWAGYSHKTASILGGSYGFIVQAGVEIFDGFSEAWGASAGDLLANGIGSGLAIGQSLLWDEQRIWMKYSFAPSGLAAIRPSLLGKNRIEQLFKDYNAQSYWLSVNVHSFFKESKWPAWLNLSFGYGIDGFVGGDDNLFENPDGSLNMEYAELPRIRQFYISPDIDLCRIKTNNKALRIALMILNCIKVPLPALEYNNQNQFQFHWIQ